MNDFNYDFTLSKNDMSEVIKNYLNLIRSRKPLSHEEERGCFLNIKNPEYKQKLIKDNLPLVFYLAKLFSSTGVSLEDLIQEGIVGLSESIDKFDLNSKNKLSSFAYWNVRWKMMLFVRMNMKQFKISSDCSNKINKLLKFYKTHNISLENLSDEQIMAFLGVPKNRVYDLRVTFNKHVSLNENNNLGHEDESGSEYTLANLIEDNTPKAYQNIINFETHKILYDIVESLNPINKTIITNRYGLKGGKPKTLNQISSLLRISKERVRQIQKETEREIRVKLKSIDYDSTSAN